MSSIKSFNRNKRIEA